MKTINKAYYKTLKQLVKAPKVGNTREINNFKISFDKDYDPVITLKHRNISRAYIVGELVWYLSGSNEMAEIATFSNFWRNISDDGRTSNSAYGYLIHKKYGFDQLEQVAAILYKDPNSRRALINLNFAHNNKEKTKDEICTIGLQFMLRRGKLNMTSIMRSNDIWFGFSYDVIYFKLLQFMLAKRLGVEVGEHTHFVSSMHLYDRDYDAAKKILKDPKQLENFTIDFEKLLRNVDKLTRYLDNKEKMLNKALEMEIIKYL